MESILNGQPSFKRLEQFLKLKEHKSQLCTKMQEAYQNDVELMVLGVLQVRFAIIQSSSRLWFQEVLNHIMMALFCTT